MTTQIDAEAITLIHNTRGGSAWDSLHNVELTTGFAVGRWGHAIAALETRYATPQLVTDAFEYLQRPRYFGTWYNPRTRISAMEQLLITDDIGVARAWLKVNHGLFIWDLDKRTKLV